MKIAILGTGRVPKTITPKLAAAGHEVVLGSRDPASPPEWVTPLTVVTVESLADAAASGELIVNALPGPVALETLDAMAAVAFEGKVLMDIGNAAVSGERGFELLYPNGSLAEEIQKALPGTRVVKSMNTMNTSVMEDPTALSGPSSIFVSGDDANAKQAVKDLLRDLGWPQEWIVDLGGLATARGPEHMFLMMLALFGSLGTMRLNFEVVR